MLTVKETTFQVAHAELNLRKRIFEGDMVVSLQFEVGFYPKQVEDTIVSGSVEVVIDLTGVHSLEEIEKKTYQGPGKVQLSLNQNGTWDYETYYDFTLTLGERKQNQVTAILQEKTGIVSFELPVTIVSLYMVNAKAGDHTFDLTPFYEIPIRKTIGDKEILKYIVKGGIK